MLGAGVMVAGGQWVFGVAFLVLFLPVYRVTVLREAEELEARFGASYRTYAAQVPTVLPRITPYRAGDSDSPRGSFSRARYLRNREWEAALGAVAAFVLLALKLRLWP
tara:strand:+ start:1090 stop:1413 length:324 start_codon:yes stop_codon:yes gene_type:complete